MHVAPALPHELVVSDVSATHVAPLQQPAHVAGSHVHAPAMQR
jgi:hypothetical protein